MSYDAPKSAGRLNGWLNNSPIDDRKIWLMRSARALPILALLALAFSLSACRSGRGYSEMKPVEELDEDSVDHGTRASVKRDSEVGTAPQDFGAELRAEDGFEPGICRTGSTFRTIRGEQATPTTCRSICDRLMDCMAFTYIAGTTDDDAARCDLKHAIPEPIEDDQVTPRGCISWVNPRAQRQLEQLAEQGFEINSERPGDDLREFALDRPEPALCQKACQNLEDCQAFTYYRPEKDGERARCALKTEALPANQDQDCCISGVK